VTRLQAAQPGVQMLAGARALPFPMSKAAGLGSVKKDNYTFT